MVDFGHEQLEQNLLEKYENVVFLTAIVKGVSAPKYQKGLKDDIALLNRQITDPDQFEQDYRSRIQMFIDGDFEKEKSEEEDDEVKDFSLIVAKFEKKIEDLARNSKSTEPTATWQCENIHFNWKTLEDKNDQIFWLYYFREEIFRKVISLSNDFQLYLKWLMTLNLIKINKEDPPLIAKLTAEKEAIQKQKDEEARLLLEEENAKKNKGKKKAPAPKKKKKMTKKEEEEERIRLEEEAEELRLQEIEAAKKLEAENAKTGESKKKQNFVDFEIINTQLSTLKPDQLTAGSFLEAYIDEINAGETGEIISQEVETADLSGIEQKQHIKTYLDDIFAQLTQSKMVNAKEIISHTPLKAGMAEFSDINGLKSDIFTINQDLDTLSKYISTAELNNHDRILIREKKLLDNLLINEVERLEEFTDQDDAVIEKALETTEINSKIQWNIEEYTRKNHIIEFEDVFQVNEPMKKWDFGDRVYCEYLDPFTTKQQLISLLNKDPDVLTNYDEKLGLLYMCLYFKTPPGLQFYKQWNSESKLIPNFKNWRNSCKTDFETQLEEEERQKELELEALEAENDKPGKKDKAKAKKGKAEAEKIEEPEEKLEEELGQLMPFKKEPLTYVNISEEDYGKVNECRSLFFPTDGSIIDIKKLGIMHKFKARIQVQKNRMLFGIKEAFQDGFNMLSDEDQAAIAEGDLEILEVDETVQEDLGENNPTEELTEKINGEEPSAMEERLIKPKEITEAEGTEGFGYKNIETGCEFWYTYDSRTRLHVELEEVSVDK